MSGKGYTMMEKLEMGDGKRIAHVMCLFSGLWVVLCVNASLALYSMHGDVECSTFSLQSASSALTMMTSLFILPAPTLSSLPLPHPSLFCSLLPPHAIFEPLVLIYVLTIAAAVNITKVHYSLWPGAEQPIILPLSLLVILIVQIPAKDFL